MSPDARGITGFYCICISDCSFYDKHEQFCDYLPHSLWAPALYQTEIFLVINLWQHLIALCCLFGWKVSFAAETLNY
jgi:hypothetical protein